ncbi:hypothetical protein EMIT0196P_60148 [Pseudomonas chlororaphis]
MNISQGNIGRVRSFLLIVRTLLLLLKDAKKHQEQHIPKEQVVYLRKE